MFVILFLVLVLAVSTVSAVIDDKLTPREILIRFLSTSLGMSLFGLVIFLLSR